jgi:hypothetical protein
MQDGKIKHCLDRATPMRHFDTAEKAKEWVVNQLRKWCTRKKFVTLTMPLKTTGLSPEEIERLK